MGRMCTLIVARPPGSYALLLAHNRDEDPGRDTAPPGLHELGEEDACLAIFPRDRIYGGSWIGCNEHGLVVGLTSWSPGSKDPKAGSRGHAVLRALGAASVERAVAAVRAYAEAAPVRSFQIVVADRERTRWLRHDGARFEDREITDDLLVLGDEAGPGEIAVEGLDDARSLVSIDGVSIDGESFDGESFEGEVAEETVDSVLDRLVVVLATGELRAREGFGHAPRATCRTGARPTISSTLLALPRGDDARLRLRYGATSPRTAAPRDYSWLARRFAR